MDVLEAGYALKHYAILRKIGQGGMGRVYAAEDTRLGRPVAIKLLPDEAAQCNTARQRLLLEARSASILNHPNIVTIYSIEEQDGVSFIVMEYVEGETLRAVFQRGPLPLPPVQDVLAGVGRSNVTETPNPGGRVEALARPGVVGHPLGEP